MLAIGFGTVLGERLSELSEERRQAVAKLEAAVEENVGLQRQLVTQAREAGVLDERGRMAREIHDTIAHGLTGIVTQLEAAEQAIDCPEDRERHIENAIRLARESLAEARRSVEASAPRSSRGATLEAGLAAVAERWSEMSGVPAEFVATGEPLAAASGDRGCPTADRAGGARQRRQARGRVAGRRDALVHGRRGDARRP